MSNKPHIAGAPPSASSSDGLPLKFALDKFVRLFLCSFKFFVPELVRLVEERMRALARSLAPHMHWFEESQSLKVARTEVKNRIQATEKARR